MKKRWPWLILIFFLGSSLPVLAMFCRQCGKTILDDSKFCRFCGTPQSVGSTQAPVQGAEPPPPVNPVPDAPRGIAGLQNGMVNNEQFMEMMKPFDAYEEVLRISNIALPNTRMAIQRTLLPNLESLRNKLKNRNLRLTRPQARLLNLYKDRYASILEAGTALGFQRDKAGLRAEQVTVLQDCLRRSLDEETLQALEKVETCFFKELRNLEDRVMNLQEQAGFENPGVCYKIRRDDLSGPGVSIDLTLYFQSQLSKVGDRMQVFEPNGKPLGLLKFVKDESGVRKYSGKLPRAAFAGETCRTIVIEYATKTPLSPKWGKQKLTLSVVPHIVRSEASEFSLEAFHGAGISLPRKKYLAALGKF